MRTRVKICGITRSEDGLAAVKYGADSIGLVFFEKSPRAVNIEDACAIVKLMPAFVTITGLFVDPEADYVKAVVDKVSIDLLQFHGAEAQPFCAGFGRRYIKAISMKGEDESENIQQYSDAAGILLDAYHPDVHGGTGKTFDWSAIPADLPAPLILAGGLNPENVADAIQQVQPYAVDVSSGVELDKGIKDSKKIAAFMSEVSRVQASL